MNPCCIAEHHGWPPPGRNSHCDLPIDEEVDHTDNDLRDNAAAYLVAAQNEVARIQLVVWRNQTEHDVPRIEDEGHANDVDDLVYCVCVEFAVVIDHVVHVYTL